ncbi:MAG: hypothetical protein F6K41_41230, partial [Symploca sp. SIO3E6]|nr:hypothetical protein [Caldora sp. SIO3E6]
PDAYIPLEAEVEVQSGNKRLRKVTDLLNAIRSDKKSRVFLVLSLLHTNISAIAALVGWVKRSATQQ